MKIRIYISNSVFILCVLLLLNSCVSRKVVQECLDNQYSDVNYNRREIDTVCLADLMSHAIQIPTRSLVGDYAGDGYNFSEFHNFLYNSFPEINKYAEIIIINKYSIVFSRTLKRG